TKWTGAATVGSSSLVDNGVLVTTAEPVGAAALGIAGDFRTSWNNQDAGSVNPLPRSCPPGQVPVSTGPFKWTCGALCAGHFSDCNADAVDGCETYYLTDVGNCGGCGMTC